MTPQTLPSKVNMVTPPKKRTMQRQYKANAQLPKYKKETVTTERAVDGQIMVLIIKKVINENKTVPGYYKPVHDLILGRAHGDIGGILGRGYLDVAASYYTFRRDSHENNKRIPIAAYRPNGREYYECAIVANPNIDIYGERVGDDSTFTLKSEKMVRDDLVKFLCDETGKKAETSFTHWEPNDSTTTNSAFAGLDTLLTDESVFNVLDNYFFPENFDNENEYPSKYKWMVENNLVNFYTRRLSDNFYNKYPIDNLGFPNTDVNPQFDG